MHIPSPFDTFGDYAALGFFAACFAGGTVASKWVLKRYFNKKTTPLADWRDNDQIMLQLREVRIRYGADRGFLAQFENGTTFASSKEKWKYSWTNEDKDSLISGIAGWRKDISVTLVPEEMKLVEEAGPSFGLTSALPDCSFKNMCADVGTEAFAYIVIGDPLHPLGFLGLYWNKALPEPVLDKLPYYSRKLEAILTGKAKKVASIKENP